MEEKKGCTVVNHYYGCCGGTGNSGAGAENVYSTEETVCGTWIDGKPIYRKVISGKLANDSGTALLFANVSDLMIDRVISLGGNTFSNNNLLQMTFQASYDAPTGLKTAVNMLYNNETGEILYHFLDTSKYYYGHAAYVIIEYTKK
jgi:hypothetical protein